MLQPSFSFSPSHFFTSHFLTPQAELVSCGHYNVWPSTGWLQTTEMRSLTSVQRPEVNVMCWQALPRALPCLFQLLDTVCTPWLLAISLSATASRCLLFCRRLQDVSPSLALSSCISSLLPACSQLHPATRPWACRSHSVCPPLRSALSYSLPLNLKSLPSVTLKSKLRLLSLLLVASHHMAEGSFASQSEDGERWMKRDAKKSGKRKRNSSFPTDEPSWPKDNSWNHLSTFQGFCCPIVPLKKPLERKK